MKNLNTLLSASLLMGFLSIMPSHVLAADLVVAPAAGAAYGAHEIFANGQIGQSFVASAVSAKVGFLVNYSAASAILATPNAPIANLVTTIYAGEGLNTTPLGQVNTTVDINTNGFVDFDLVAAGITLTPGSTYTLGMSIDNRGWINPSACTYPTGAQPTGMYDLGHPFFNGQIVLNETGICDNSFHIVDLAPVTVVPTPNPTPVVTPTPTPTPSVTPVASVGKKVEGKGIITAVDGNMITINNMVFIIAPYSYVNLNDNHSIMIGQRAEYKGFMNTDGTVTLSKIEIK